MKMIAARKPLRAHTATPAQYMRRTHLHQHCPHRCRLTARLHQRMQRHLAAGLQPTLEHNIAHHRVPGLVVTEIREYFPHYFNGSIDDQLLAYYRHDGHLWLAIDIFMRAL